ncbi:MAG: HYR domain-containing protein, partial [Verrucomicrobiota bacterium]
VAIDTETFAFPLPAHSPDICIGGVAEGSRFLDIGDTVFGDGHFLNGRVDQFLLYDRVLTEDDLSGLIDTNRLTTTPGSPTVDEDCTTSILLSREDVVTPGSCTHAWSIDRIWSATDACGNLAVSTQQLNVADQTAPALICPPDIVVSNGFVRGGALVHFTVQAMDDLDAHPIVDCFPPAGSVFPFGTTTVECVAIDACGNSNTCSFTVSVMNGAADDDGDGVSNLDEWRADTDPNDPDSALRIVEVSGTPAGSLICWQGGIAVTQYLECATSPTGPWIPVYTNLPPTAVTASNLHHLVDMPLRFYRIRVDGR